MEGEETEKPGEAAGDGAPAEGEGGDAQAPTEEELRAQLEEEIRKVRIEDVILQGLVPILNLSARRIAKDDERDLAQGKAGIDAAQAMLEFIPEEARPQIQQAISELQLLYAKYASEGGAGAVGGEESGSGAASEAGAEPEAGEKPPKPAGKGDSGLWTPPGS